MINTESAHAGFKQSLRMTQPPLYRWFEQYEEIINRHRHNPLVVTDVDWRLIGNGLIVEGVDQDACLQFLEWVCESLAVEFIRIQSCGLESLKGRLQDSSDPAVIFIEPSAWLEGEDISDEDFQDRQLLQELFKLISGKPFVFASICSAYDGIAEDFRYQGKFDRHIAWMPPKPEFYARNFIEMVGAQYLDEELVQGVHRLGSLLCLEFPTLRRLGMLSIATQRKSMFTSTPMGWKDMLEFAIHGTGDAEYEHLPEVDLKQIAAHEAGHALMAIVESGGQHLPDWVSILPGNGMVGIVVEDYAASFNSNKFMSFKRVRSTIRISLAGRVAEEVLMGELNVLAGCSDQDLREASWSAINLVCKSGFIPSYGENEYQGENLLVAYKNYVSADSEYFNNRARTLMRDQYRFVKEVLKSNLSLLKLIQEALLRERLLLKPDLENLINGLRSGDRLAA